MARPRIVIVGAGFAGFQTARTLTRLAQGAAEIVVLNPTDYFLYLPLLPEVSGGVLEPRRVAVSLTKTLPGIRLVLGEAHDIDLDQRAVWYAGPEGDRHRLSYDRLVIAAGSVNKLLPIPGVGDHAHGFRGLPEALYLRDQLIRQMEMADVADDPDERTARCTFVVVGAGYTGTEVAAQGQLLTRRVARHHPRLRPRWLLLDVADQVLPGMHPHLSTEAERVLRARGIEVGLGTSVEEATERGVRLSDGRFIPSRTLVWCVGVKPDPLAATLGLPMTAGRLQVDEYLSAPGHPEVFACGDAAAVPDPANPDRPTPMTAQHAVRQGRLAAHNIAASYGVGRRRPYRYRERGFLVDLGGLRAAANPLNIPLSGPAARAATLAYHLVMLPANRTRTFADWVLTAIGGRQTVQLNLVRGSSVPLDTASPELVHA